MSNPLNFARPEPQLVDRYVPTAEDWAEYAAYLDGELEAEAVANANAELSAIADEQREAEAEAEAAAIQQVAFNSHDWTTFDGIDYNCAACDCKPWHKAARRQCRPF